MALSTETKREIMGEFAQGSKDTGSVEVQVALLTRTIEELTKHCQTHKKDFSCKRGLLKMVCRRRTFLRYLERNDVKKYKDVIERLQLRK